MRKLLLVSAVMSLVVILVSILVGSTIFGNVVLPNDFVREGWEGAVFFSVVYLVFLSMYSLIGLFFENIKDGNSNKYRDGRVGKKVTKSGKIRKNSRKR